MNMSIVSDDSEIFGSKAKQNMTPQVRHEKKLDDESKKVAKTLSSLRAINKGAPDLRDVE